MNKKTQQKLTNLYHSCNIATEVLRVGFNDGTVICGLTPYGYQQIASRYGGILWVDIIEGEWLEVGGESSFSYDERQRGKDRKVLVSKCKLTNAILNSDFSTNDDGDHYDGSQYL